MAPNFAAWPIRRHHAPLKTIRENTQLSFGTEFQVKVMLAANRPMRFCASTTWDLSLAQSTPII
jgi:hypothetical protein